MKNLLIAFLLLAPAITVAGQAAKPLRKIASALEPKEIAEKVVTQMYGRDGDSVVATLKSKNIYQVALNSASGSAVYDVKFRVLKEETEQGGVVADIKITYQGGN